MPQYKYPVKGGAKWMTKFNYTDPKSGYKNLRRCLSGVFDVAQKSRYKRVVIGNEIQHF